jgi:UDP-N-acetylmuramoyl-L-alanyl-D-glutamate--2,6-diaminopimelate ligase
VTTRQRLHGSPRQHDYPARDHSPVPAVARARIRTSAPAPLTVDAVAGVVGGRVLGDGHGVAVVDVTHDSREAGPGVLFACRPGTRADGHDFAGQAVAAGSPALLVERPVDAAVPQVQVSSVARALGLAAAAVHGHPADALELLGVTGTNGKTTVATLLEAVLARAGHLTGLVGTTGARLGGEALPGLRTTPESTDLQRLWRRMREAGATAAVMEVSSHGLALGRMLGTRVDVAGFTNLSQDHLDFHADMEDYFAAKAELFTPRCAERAAVVVDDAWGRRLAEQAGVPVTTISGAGRDADVRAAEVSVDATGSALTAVGPGWRQPLRVSLPGPFNVTNALLALAMADLAGVDRRLAADAIAAVPGVRGRMERVEAGQPFTVLVDYAHTSAAVEGTLAAARALTRGRVIVVVGCGGDRDRDKRAPMGAAAASGADLAVLTSDNPRTEDPERILDAVAAGAAEVAGARVHREPDRRVAIAAALKAARPGDVVVIAGKGHETVQELADRVVDFDDRAVAAELLGAGRAREPVEPEGGRDKPEGGGP